MFYNNCSIKTCLISPLEKANLEYGRGKIAKIHVYTEQTFGSTQVLEFLQISSVCFSQ
jgi:hypothetical protein